jgi:thiocyanate desulfurase
LLKVVAGTAVAGEAAAATYSWVTSGSASDQGARNAGARYAEAQRENIERTLIDSKSDVGGRGLGKWIALLPTKLGGGTYALDLNTNRVLSSIWYWTYGDFNPISHHLCAFPSADPYHSFEFINSTQGGKNCLIYGINTRMEAPEPGFNIYRVSATTARKWS